MDNIQLAKTAPKRHLSRRKLIKRNYNIDIEPLLYLPGKLHIYWKDLKLTYHASNDQMAEVNRLANRAEVSERTDNDLLWVGQAGQFQKDDRLVIKSGKAKQFYNFSILPDREITYYTIKTPLKNTEGKIIGVFGISHYITEQFNDDELNLLCDAGIPLNLANFSQFNQTLLEIQCKKLKISRRQGECLYYLARGMTIKQIGRTLTLSPRTVENYIEIVKHKLNCYSKNDLIAKCFELGLSQFMKKSR